MNAADCRTRLREIERRQAQGVRLFPDDFEALLYLARFGLTYLADHEAAQAQAARTFAAIPRSGERAEPRPGIGEPGHGEYLYGED